MSLFFTCKCVFGCGYGTACFMRSHVSIGSDDDRCCPAAPQFVSADLTVSNSSVAVRGAETLSQVSEAAPTLHLSHCFVHLFVRNNDCSHGVYFLTDLFTS